METAGISNGAAKSSPRIAGIRGSLSEATDVMKLQRIKKLIAGANQQNRRKLAIMERAINQLAIPNQITNETKTICSIIIEIQEILKPFPELSMSPAPPIPKKANGEPDKFAAFKINVLQILASIEARLKSVDDFIKNTNSLPEAMAVAVAVRDITKHLKIVTEHRGTKLISVPEEDAPKKLVARLSDGARVTEIVNYYSKLSKGSVQSLEFTALQRNVSASDLEVTTPSSGRKGSAPVPPLEYSNGNISARKTSTPLESLEYKHERAEEECECPPEESEVTEVVAEEDKRIMEAAVKVHLDTLNRKNGSMMASMLNDPSINDFFSLNAQAPFTESTTACNSARRFLEKKGRVYFSGSLKKKYTSMMSFGKTWKPFYWVLDSQNLSCFQSEVATYPLKVYPIRAIRNCSWDGRLPEVRRELDMVSLEAKNEKKLTLQATKDVEMVRWICALDGAQIRANMDPSLLNPIDKHRLLSYAYKDKHAGGEIQSSYEEAWSYTKDGMLKSSLGLDPPLCYRWDGEMLIGLDNQSRDLGSGKWDGITLVWYNETFNGMIATPTISYDWNAGEQEYTNAAEDSQVWKWTRHFLASKFGAGEWIVEGQVPQPVVMFLQMIRTSRLQRSVDQL